MTALLAIVFGLAVFLIGAACYYALCWLFGVMRLFVGSPIEPDPFMLGVDSCPVDADIDALLAGPIEDYAFADGTELPH